MAKIMVLVMKRKTFVFLLLIIILGAFLRLYKLDKFPPSLFGDEVDVGYQAYSILKTGKDYLGQAWPVSFHSLADWRTPLFLYTDVPFVALFGLNEWGVRLPASLFGILTLPFFFLLTKKLLQNEKLALVATFFLAISPWHLQYSRAAFEVTQMLFLIIVGLYFFLRGLERWPYLIGSAIFLALAPYSYNTAKFFLPLFGLLLIFCFWQKIKKIPLKKLAIAVSIFILILLPMTKDIFFGKAAERFSILSIFTDPTVAPQIGFERQTDMKVMLGEVPIGTAPSFSSRVFHNKYLSWGLTLTKNYFRSFSTEFLFTNGDINFRHSIQGGFGQLWWFDIVFLGLGLFFLFTKIKDEKVKKFIIWWLLLAPLPSVLTREGGTHATRLILMLPPLLLVISLGFYQFLTIFGSKKQKLLWIFLVLIFIGQFSIYWHRYYVHYPLESEEWWHYGFKQTAAYAKQNGNKYDYIVFSDTDEPPLIFYLFWLKVDPRIVQENKLIWTQINDAIRADHLPQTKYYFGHISEERISNSGLNGILKSNILYLAPQVEIKKDFRLEPVPSSIELLQTIYYPSGRMAEYILTGK